MWDKFVQAVPLPVDSDPSMDDIDSAPEEPPPIPKLNKAEKWALIRAYGKDPTTRRRRKHDRSKTFANVSRCVLKIKFLSPSPETRKKGEREARPGGPVANHAHGQSEQ